MQSTLSIKQTLAAPENTKWVIALLKADPPPNRTGLAKELCRRLELRDSKGDWQIATTSKALRELEDQGLWQLPKPRSQRAREWHPTRLNHPAPAPTELPELLQDARGLCLIEVADEEHLGFWLQNRQLDPGGPNQRPRTQRAQPRRQEHQGRLSISTSRISMMMACIQPVAAA